MLPFCKKVKHVAAEQYIVFIHSNMRMDQCSGLFMFPIEFPSPDVMSTKILDCNVRTFIITCTEFECSQPLNTFASYMRRNAKILILN